MLSEQTYKKLITLFVIIFTIYLTIYYSKNSFHYYLTISEYLEKPNKTSQSFTIIGKVKKIILHSSSQTNFILYDQKEQIYVRYIGITPRMFNINQEVIITGKMNKENEFISTTLLVKHDEIYSPTNYTLKSPKS